MNLYDSSRVIPFKPELRFLPDGASQRVPSCWGPPQVQIFEDERAGWVMEAVNTLLARPDVHVCAVSPAAVCATPEIGRHSGEPTGVWSPSFAITVIYQQRTPQAAAVPISEAA